MQNYENEVIRLINEIRRQHKLQPLIDNRALTKAARGHSQDMARRNFFAHVTPEGNGIKYRTDRVGFQNRAAAENIYQSQNLRTTPQEAVNAWMNSTGHRKNILTPIYRYTGVGLGSRSSPRPTYFWTQVFGA